MVKYNMNMVDQCPLCGGDKIIGKTIFSVDLGFGVVLVRDVPATLCSQCGADWLSDDVAARLEEMVQDARFRHLQVEVTTYQTGEKPSLEPAP